MAGARPAGRADLGAGKLGYGESKLIRPLDGSLLLFRRVLAPQQKPLGLGGEEGVIETSGMPRQLGTQFCFRIVEEVGAETESDLPKATQQSHCLTQASERPDPCAFGYPRSLPYPPWS